MEGRKEVNNIMKLEQKDFACKSISETKSVLVTIVLKRVSRTLSFLKKKKKNLNISFELPF